MSRKWNDLKGLKDTAVQGKFERSELLVLTEALCQHTAEEGMEVEEFFRMCTVPAKEMGVDGK